MEPESVYVVSAVSVHWLEYGDCDGVDPGKIQYQDNIFSSWLATTTLSS